MSKITEVTDRIDKDLNFYGFDSIQKIGFFFYLGYCSEQFAREQGIYGSNSIESGIMENSPCSYLLDDDYEVEENMLGNSDDVRSCFLTFAKVIHEDWVKAKQPLNQIINVGSGYLFTDEINEEIWNYNQGKDFNGTTIDEGYLHFFSTLGNVLNLLKITDINDCLWYGKDLFFASIFDDIKSYSYVVDKLNTLIPPCLKLLLSYPVKFELNKLEYQELSSFSNILKACLKLESNKTIRDQTFNWHKVVMFGDDGNLKDEYELNEDNLGPILMQMAYDGFQFKYSIEQDIYNEIYNEGNVYKLEQEDKIIDLNTYATIGVQIVHQTFGYDYRIRNWSNYGMFLQFLSLYFITMVRYSVYPKELNE